MVRKNLDVEWRVVLSALYLAGSPHRQHLDRRRWPAVLGGLRALGVVADEAGAGLRAKGFFAEAAALSSSDALTWARNIVDAGRVRTCLCSGYPERWLAVMGDLAPPVAWARSGVGSSIPCLGIVGSRDVDPLVHRFCADAAREAVGLGYRVVSGGAIGCDRAALDAVARGGGHGLCLLPYGIDLAEQDPPAHQGLLSFSEPAEPFSRGRAMERNALIYAASRVTIVGQVRFRQGGTWHGATSAIRRRTTQLLVRRPGPYEQEDAIRGARALVSLGANYLDEPAQLGAYLATSIQDLGLFASLRAG